MPVRRGLVPPAIIGSTIALVVCACLWAALGVLALTPAVELPVELYKFLCTALATLTICAASVHMTARALRAILAAITAEAQTVCGYADGYTDGLDARPGGAPGAPVSPVVRGLVRSPR